MSLLSVLGGFSLGASFMYMLDPARGRRRRAILLDKSLHAVRAGRLAAGKTTRDLRNRIAGFFYSLRSGASGATAPPDDEVLAARIRSNIGGLMRHPRALDIETQGGRVILSGPILADEVDRVVGCVSSLPGVYTVDNLMEVYEREEGVPRLQGESRRRRRESLITLETPTSRLVTGAAGAALLFFGWRWLRNGSGMAFFE